MTTLDVPMPIHALHRTVDHGGVSGTGIVAYALELPSGSVLMLWDTGWPTISILPDLATVDAIHGHGGDTEIRPVSQAHVGDEHLSRTRELLLAAAPRLRSVVRDLGVAGWPVAA